MQFKKTSFIENQSALNPNQQDDMYYKTIFIVICLIWFVLWSALPLLIYQGPYVDTSENIIIGREILWGYDKHPYFGVWIMRLVFTISGSFYLSFIFSQIAIFIFLLSSWKLARYFLSPGKALLSILFLLSNPVYSITSIMFNQNIILIALWALIILFYCKALLNQKISDWILLGIFCGLGLMTKYFCVFLFAPMALWLLFTAQGRASFKHIGLYLCVVSFLIIIIPNVIWLFENNFASIVYAAHKSDINHEHSINIIKHLISPLTVLGMVLGSFAYSIITFFICFREKNISASPEIPGSMKEFVLFIFLAPLTFVCLFTLITGVIVKGDWLFTLCGTAGLIIILFWKPELTRKKIKCYLIFLAIFCFCSVILHSAYVLYYTPYLQTNCVSLCKPTLALSDNITAAWHKKFNTSLRYLAGDIMLSSRISLFSKDHPESVFISSEYNHRNKTSIPDYYHHGAVLIWNGQKPPEWLDEFKDYNISDITTEPYPRLVKPWFRKFMYNVFGLNPKEDFYSFAFIKPHHLD
ncbi:MAG TPA: hypothetical protein DD381_02530 [Lentisphaeria bacterium]|nr:MAG: hypothetical protein A2X47_03720 [Lentisphaerae bacterium GWF2_38_69]HBM15211.1 hypothetical protein [Lentisphaeria bacterium]